MKRNTKAGRKTALHMTSGQKVVQCTRVEFPIAARGCLRVERRPAAIVEYSLQAPFPLSK